ncbi:MAG: hypothetical protein ACI4R9_01450 [Kiritimatiellia bacterium]
MRNAPVAASNPWRFSSEYAEDDTATVYYNYRHYEPVMGGGGVGALRMGNAVSGGLGLSMSIEEVSGQWRR